MYSFLKSKFTAHNQHWLIYAQIIGSILSLIQLIILSRVLNPEIFGQYRYALALSLIIPLFSLSGISNALTARVSETKNNLLFFPAVRLFLHSTKIPSLILMTISAILFYFQNHFLAGILFALAILSPLYQATQLYSSYLNGFQDYRRIFLFGLIPDSISILCVIIASLIFPTSPILILIVFLCSNIFAGYIATRLTIRAYTIRMSKENTESELLALSKTVSYSNIIQGIGGQIDKLISFHFISSSGLAVYSIVTLVAQQFRGFQKILYAVLLPKQTTNKDHSVFYKAVGMYVSISTLFTTTYVICAPTIFKLLFPLYVPFVHLSQIASIAIIFVPITFFTLSTLHSRNAKKQTITYSAITTIFSSIFLLIGSLISGTPGIVVAFVVSSFFSALVGLLFLRSLSKHPKVS